MLDRERDYRNAAGLLAIYFEREERDSGDGELALWLVDAYLELGEAELAKATLRNELARSSLSQSNRQALVRRLAGLEPESN